MIHLCKSPTKFLIYLVVQWNLFAMTIVVSTSPIESGKETWKNIMEKATDQNNSSCNGNLEQFNALAGAGRWFISALQ